MDVQQLLEVYQEANELLVKYGLDQRGWTFDVNSRKNHVDCVISVQRLFTLVSITSRTHPLRKSQILYSTRLHMLSSAQVTDTAQFGKLKHSS